MLKKTKIRLSDIEIDIKLLKSKSLTGIERCDKLDSDIHKNSETLVCINNELERTLNKLNALAKYLNLEITYPGGLAKVDLAPTECFPCSKCNNWTTETAKERLCNKCKSLTRAELNKGGASK